MEERKAMSYDKDIPAYAKEMKRAIGEIIKKHLDEHINPGLIVEALAKTSVDVCKSYENIIGAENVDIAALFLNRFEIEYQRRLFEIPPKSDI